MVAGGAGKVVSVLSKMRVSIDKDLGKYSLVVLHRTVRWCTVWYRAVSIEKMKGRVDLRIELVHEKAVNVLKSRSWTWS